MVSSLVIGHVGAGSASSAIPSTTDGTNGTRSKDPELDSVEGGMWKKQAFDGNKLFLNEEKCHQITTELHDKFFGDA